MSTCHICGHRGWCADWCGKSSQDIANEKDELEIDCAFVQEDYETVLELLKDSVKDIKDLLVSASSSDFNRGSQRFFTDRINYYLEQIKQLETKSTEGANQ